MNVVLTAGTASRLGRLAPNGCKALVKVKGKPMAEHFVEAMGSVTFVCRSKHADALGQYGNLVICDDGGGPARALRAAMTDEPVTLAFADSYFKVLPQGEDWMGVAFAKGGRAWDTYNGVEVTHQRVPHGTRAIVCTGLYQFASPDRLWRVLDGIPFEQDIEFGMGSICNAYGLTPVNMPDWRDVGDASALSAVGMTEEVAA